MKFVPTALFIVCSWLILQLSGAVVPQGEFHIVVVHDCMFKSFTD